MSEVNPYEHKRHVLQTVLKRAQVAGFVLKDPEHLVARDKYTGNIIGWETWVFDPDFAKAVWGLTPKICGQCERPHASPADCDCGGWPMSAIEYWQYQLRELLFSADRILFLEEHAT